MKTSHAAANSGIILIGALLLLSLGLSAMCLLVAAANHHQLWRNRLEREQTAQSQRNRLVRVSHFLMDRLMSQTLPEPEEIQRDEHWQETLSDCMDPELAACSLAMSWQSIGSDPFQPRHLGIELNLTTRDQRPGMCHQAMIQGDFYAGSFPLGSVPILIGQGTQPQVGYDSVFSRITLTESFAHNDKNWLDPLPLLMLPLGVTGGTIDWPRIGAILGMELAGPPQPGVYPVWQDKDLQALFVYGTVDRLRLSQNASKQKIDIYQGQRHTRLEYSADPPSCTLQELDLGNGVQFAQNLIIIGNVLALEQTGEYGLASFCKLYIYVNGSVYIRSDLRSVPAAEPGQKKGSLTLVSACAISDVLSLPAGIFLDLAKRMELDAHLISGGAICNNSRELVVNGSLSAATFSGCDPQVLACPPERELPNGPEIRFFKNLMFMGIQEVFDDTP